MRSACSKVMRLELQHTVFLMPTVESLENVDGGLSTLGIVIFFSIVTWKPRIGSSAAIRVSMGRCLCGRDAGKYHLYTYRGVNRNCMSQPTSIQRIQN